MPNKSFKSNYVTVMLPVRHRVNLDHSLGLRGVCVPQLWLPGPMSCVAYSACVSIQDRPGSQLTLRVLPSSLEMQSGELVQQCSTQKGEGSSSSSWAALPAFCAHALPLGGEVLSPRPPQPLSFPASSWTCWPDSSLSGMHCLCPPESQPFWLFGKCPSVHRIRQRTQIL